MAHYRVYKLNDTTGRIVKGKDVEASDDGRAMETAQRDEDCPTCEVWRGATKIGTVD